MPRGDRTGPPGFGPMTGWGTGCGAAPDRPGFRRPAWKPTVCGSGAGRGYRHGFQTTGSPGWTRFCLYPAFSPAVGTEEELGALRGEAEHLERILEGIRRRIETLEEGSKKKTVEGDLGEESPPLEGGGI